MPKKIEPPQSWKPEDIDEAQVRYWLKHASVNNINVFNDYNRIIKTLCKIILISWGKKPWNDQ